MVILAVSCAAAPPRTIKPGQKRAFSWSHQFWVYEQGLGRGTEALELFVSGDGGELVVDNWPVDWSNGPPDRDGKRLVWFLDLVSAERQDLLSAVGHIPFGEIESESNDENETPFDLYEACSYGENQASRCLALTPQRWREVMGQGWFETMLQWTEKVKKGGDGPFEKDSF